MISFDLAESGDVVDEVGQCHVCLGPQDADAAKNQTSRRALDEAEYMPDTAADFRFTTVGCFLRICQRVVAGVFVALLVWALLSQLIPTAFPDGFVFLPCVALTGTYHEAGVYHLSFADCQAEPPEVGMECLEKGVGHTLLHKTFSVGPQCPRIGHVGYIHDSEEVTETGPICATASVSAQAPAPKAGTPAPSASGKSIYTSSP